jgi:hypothetical protein
LLGWVAWKRVVDALEKWGFQTCLLISALALILSCAVLDNIVFAQAKSNQNVTLTINGQTYTSDNAAIIINWGTVCFGDNTKTVTIANNADVNLIAHLNVAGLPFGWTLTFSLQDQTLTAGDCENGTLTLFVPEDTLDGSYSWSANISLKDI